jgi:hypothetical protein
MLGFETQICNQSYITAIPEFIGKAFLAFWN